jgi:transmembrane sensor
VTVPPRISEPDPLLDEALDWVVRLRTGEPTRADIEALQQWRGRSVAHEDAFKRAAQIFRHAGIAAVELAVEQARKERAPANPRRRVFVRRALLGGAAAAAAGYMVVRPPFGLWPPLQELAADYRTKKGEQRTISVVSGVSLELSTQTSVALRESQDQTKIELISGEAVVTATRPASNPLVMLAAGGQIVATEANFDARCLDGGVSVTCLAGAVSVEQQGRTVELRPAEQVSYSLSGIEASHAVDVAQVTAWRSGLLIFRDRPLSSVIDEVNRYRSGKIIILNADLRRRLVNGTFQINKLENFVAQVQQLFGVRATSLPGGVVLLS